MFQAVDLFDEKTLKAINLGEKRNKFMKFVEEFDFLSSKPLDFGQRIDTPILDIKLDRKNIDYINSVIARSLDQSENVYTLGPFVSIYDNDFVEDTETTILFDGKEYDAKIKLHGVADDNWINPKKSYSIKTNKEDLIENTRRFRLIIFEEQFIQTLFAYHVAKHMDYMDIGADIVRLRFNGVDQGLYLYEESLSKGLLEKNNLAGVDVIKAHDEWTHQYKTGHITLFTHELANQDYKNYSGIDVGQLLLFKQLIEAKNYEEIKYLVDLDRFALHEAMRILFGTDQAITGDNIRFLFDTTSGKFFPHFRMEGYLISLPSSKLSNTFDHDLNDWFGSDYKIQVFPILNRNNEFRALRNQYLFKLLSSREILEAYYLDLYEKYYPLVGTDRTNNYPTRWYLNKMKSSLSSLSSNFNYIDKYLNYSKVFASLIQVNEQEYILEIVPDSNSTLQVKSIDIGGLKHSTKLEIRNLSEKNSSYRRTTLNQYFSDKYFSLSLDELLEIKKNIYRFQFKVDEDINIESFNIAFQNSITGKDTPIKETYTKFIRTPAKLQAVSDSRQDLISHYMSLYPGLELKNEELVFTKGSYDIKEDVILPNNLTLRLEAGSEIGIFPDVSILVKGNLFVDGTQESPVRVFNIQKNRSFGVLGAVGDGKTTVDISNLDISGGSEDIIAGIYLSGGLSLYHHKQVNISNSFIHNNEADDGLNIKNANIFMTGSKLAHNFADQADLDYCTGLVSNNLFEIATNQELSDATEIPNGDGLDMSGSDLIVRNNTFRYFLDKAISVGEHSVTMLSSNSFEENRSAVTLKDESSGFFFSNTYLDNQVNLEMFLKKPIFKHPSAFNFNETYSESKIVKTSSSHYYKLKEMDNDMDLPTLLGSNVSPDTYLPGNKKFEWIEYE